MCWVLDAVGLRVLRGVCYWCICWCSCWVFRGLSCFYVVIVFKCFLFVFVPDAVVATYVLLVGWTLFV